MPNKLCTRPIRTPLIPHSETNGRTARRPIEHNARPTPVRSEISMYIFLIIEKRNPQKHREQLVFPANCLTLQERRGKTAPECMKSSRTGLPNQRNNLKKERMETIKLIVKWVLIIGAIILFDRACSPRDISKMPPRTVLIESYSMYNPAGIKSAYQKFDSLRANAPFAQRSDSLEATAEADTAKADTAKATIQQKITYYTQGFRCFTYRETVALSLPIVLAVFLLLILVSFYKMRSRKTRVKLSHGAKGIDANGRNQA